MSLVTILEKVVDVALFLHISAGFSSIVLFWIPTLTKKGSNIHRKVGKVYIFLMWIVIFSGIVLTFNKFNEGVMDAAIFLGFLVLLAARPVWYGTAILKSKKKLSSRLKNYHILLRLALCVYGIFMLIFSIMTFGQGLASVMLIFAVLGMIAGIDAYRDYKSTSTTSNWLREHFEGMIISGVAAYTAFLIIGGNAFISQYMTGYWLLIPWLSPTIIGMVLIYYYRRQTV
jgi:uncharacterized membrane protein